MEWRVNVLFLGVLALAALGLTPSGPVSALDPRDPSTRELADLEDALARDGHDVDLAQRLAERYLELDRPGLAVAALRAADPAVLEHPVVAHRLAQAYEASGRILDAEATARLALARCARALGTAHAPSGTPVPRHSCSARQHASLTMHEAALTHMVRWGVADPAHDPRSEVAYDLAMRRAHVAAL